LNSQRPDTDGNCDRRRTHPLLGYLPHQGLPSHREIISGWPTTFGINADVSNLFVTHGGSTRARSRVRRRL